MYIDQTQAFVVIVTHKPYEGHPALQARSWLRCPHCRAISEESGPPIRLTEGPRPTMLRHVQLKPLLRIDIKPDSYDLPLIGDFTCQVIENEVFDHARISQFQARSWAYSDAIGPAPSAA